MHGGNSWGTGGGGEKRGKISMLHDVRATSSNLHLKNCVVPIPRTGMGFALVDRYLSDFIVPCNFYRHESRHSGPLASRLSSDCATTCERYTLESV
jgi:hypothetical protein